MKCARCGAEAVDRTNRATGAKVTGCSAWPKCNWTLKVREVCTDREGMRDMQDEEDGVGDYDERNPMLDDFEIFHD